MFRADDLVRVAMVDEDSWQGRDPHPEPELVGVTGTVVQEWHDPVAYESQLLLVEVDGTRYVFAEYELAAA